MKIIFKQNKTELFNKEIVDTPENPLDVEALEQSLIPFNDYKVKSIQMNFCTGITFESITDISDIEPDQIDTLLYIFE